MPKIIKDIEQKIFDGAIDLFSEYGYRKVDMKMISKKAGIAVGTLYNYYPNKKDLYIHVFRRSWKDTFHKLDRVMEERIDNKEIIRKFIYTLYDEISKRKGLGGELLKENVIDKEDKDTIFYIKEELMKKIEVLINNVKEVEGLKLDEGMERRLAGSLFFLIIGMNTEYAHEKEENIRFMIQLIECTYGK